MVEKKIIHLIEGEKNSKDLFLEIKLVSPICTHYKKILVSEREVNKLTLHLSEMSTFSGKTHF